MTMRERDLTALQKREPLKWPVILDAVLPAQCFSLAGLRFSEFAVQDASGWPPKDDLLSYNITCFPTCTCG